MSQTLTMNDCGLFTGAAAAYRNALEDAVGHKDRMDEPHHRARLIVRDAVPIVGPRGGVRKPSGMRPGQYELGENIAEDVDEEEAMIARLDGPGDGDDERGEDCDEREFDEEDDEEDVPMFVGGVSLERYLNEQDDLVYEDESDEEAPPVCMAEELLLAKEIEAAFGTVKALMGVETAEVARAEGRLLALHSLIDRVTAPPPAPMPAEKIDSRKYDPYLGKAFETAPGIELDAFDDLRPYQRLAAAAEAERDPSFLRRRSN